MVETSNDLKTISVEKDTWVMELPEELCLREGFAKGTLASLTVKKGAINGTFIHPSQKAKESSQDFISKFGDFMQEMKKIDD
jgi:hypothetical protein